MSQITIHRPQRFVAQVTGTLTALLLALLSLSGATCPGPGAANGGGQTLNLPAGETMTVENNEPLTLTGDSVIDGTLKATGLLILRVEGSLTVNGSLEAVNPTAPETPDNTPFDQAPAGIYIIMLGSGALTFNNQATVRTNGSVVVTDDPDLLSGTPGEMADDVENVSGDNLPTLVPLPPDNMAFNQKSIVNKKASVALQGAGVLPPIFIAGTWPPPGTPAPPGDKPVIIFHFTGMRDLDLGNWTVNGPPAPAGASADKSGAAGSDATGKSGKNGLNLNITNTGGPINIVGNVTLNLSDGGDGGSATAVCASAIGGDGGKAGNFKMSASGGVDLTAGTLTINPGHAGAGGDATVTKGDPAAAGCPGGTGRDATAHAGRGADNEKRLFVRGAVAGLTNLFIGPLFAGDGGIAKADACDGGPGLPCCDGGPGGAGNATGGKGGNASLNIGALVIGSVGAVFAGNGGDATATGGKGGKGGDCKFGDAGDGGAGGAATATAGNGGKASASGGGVAAGGTGGDATATGGDGGAGGDSGFGTPGSGGAGGTATATKGTGGAGAPAGPDGNATPSNGNKGPDGNNSTVTLFCFSFAFVPDDAGIVPTGVQTGPVFAADNVTQIGSLSVEFRNVTGAQYRTSTNPVKHIGLQDGGQLDIRASSLQQNARQSPLIGGLRIIPLAGTGLSESNPLTVQAFDASGTVIGTKSFASLPDNTAAVQGMTTTQPALQSVDALFANVTQSSVATFRISTPPASFVTIIQIYLLDP